MKPISQGFCDTSLLDTLITKATLLGTVQQMLKTGAKSEEDPKRLESDVCELREEARRRMNPVA